MRQREFEGRKRSAKVSERLANLFWLDHRIEAAELSVVRIAQQMRA
jgi:hypothetical protein